MEFSSWRQKHIKPRKYYNLHHHDEYSLRIALGRTADMIPILKERCLTHYAVTNHSEISGWVNQYFTCVDNGIVPILGVEMYLSNYKIVKDEKKVITEVECFSPDGCWKKPFDDVPQDDKDEIKNASNILLLAKDLDGYNNIIKCHNDSQLNGYYDRPRLNDLFMSKNAKGIIAISPMPYGDIYRNLSLGKADLAYNRVLFYRKVFGEVYMELCLAENDGYKEYCEKAIKFCQEHAIPMIISNNSHCINKSDEETLQLLLEMRKTRKTSQQNTTDMFGGMHYKTEAEMRELFHSKYKSDIFTEEIFDNCMATTNNIIEQIQTIPLDTSPKMPKFENAEQIIRENTYKGLRKIFENPPQDYIDRVEYELDNITRAGFADYFLFLEDICENAIKNGNLTGAGRGSACGSLVMYCLGVTHVDSIKYNLLFERFLDASRLDEVINKGGKLSVSDMPDVDIDVMSRDAVIKYLVDKYGEKRMCSIGSIGRLKNKSVLLDLCRVFKIDLQEIYEITKGGLKDIEKAEDDAEDCSLDELKKLLPQLELFLQKYPQIERHFEKLRGSISYFGKHAGGIIVSDIDLTDMLPVRRVENKIVSCWSEGIEDRELGRMGFVKMDILNVDAVNQIVDTIALIKEMNGEKIDMYNIPLEDKDAMKLCEKYDFTGIFQLESPLSESVVKAMNGIERFEDISAVSALMRPSALANKSHVKFGDRRTNREEWHLPECLIDTMAVTYGLPIYQEAAYHVARHLAGFSIVEAYKFMKKLYKNQLKKEDIPYWFEKFMKGCQSKIDSKETTEVFCKQIFTELLAFQGYGFCAGHAHSYSVITMWQLYLKANYLSEFMCSLIRHTPRTKEKHGHSLLEARVKYAVKNGIRVLPPDINNSGVLWTLEDAHAIRIGIGDLYGIGKGAEDIVKYQPYKSVQNFLDKMPSNIANKSRFESLLFAGCFDVFDNRMDIYNWYVNVYSKNKNQDIPDESQLMFDLGMENNEKATPIFFSKKELKEREMKAIGFSLDFEFLDKYRDIMEKEQLKTIGDVKDSKIKYPKIICKVVEHSPYLKKDGRRAVKTVLTDGFDDAYLYMDADAFDVRSKYFEDDNILILNVVVGEEKRNYYSLNKKEDIKKLN